MKEQKDLSIDEASAKLSQEDIERMMREQQRVMTALPKTIVVGGKKYRVRQVSQKVRTKIDNLALEAYFLQQESQKEVTLRRAKRINTKLRNTHAKVASYYLLGNWALFVPFLWAIRWRWMALRNSEVVFRINDAGASDPDTGFYFANWEIIKGILALSTRSVGEGIMQFNERKESAESMVKEDATKKKEEDSKSGVSSKKARTTKK